MSKKKNKVLTLDDILKRKEFFENRKNEVITLDIETLNCLVKVKKTDITLYNECMSMDSPEGDKRLIYECMVEPNLKNTELIEAFDCFTPLDIVEKIFDPLEIYSLTSAIIEVAGYNSVSKVIEETKN